MWAEDVYPDTSPHHPKYYASIYKTPQNLKENSDEYLNSLELSST